MMFSNNHLYPQSQQSSSLPNFHSFPSNSGYETKLLQHLLQPVVNQDPCTFSTPLPNNEVITSHVPNCSNGLYEPICNQAMDGLSSTKKVRHSKISTAQGVRDRRVRLSMGIAREFFDLQDKLGFDKASKTLGWLLAKSKGAIQELALEKQILDFHGSFSFDTNYEDAIGKSRPSSGSTLMRRKRRRMCKLQEIDKVSARENRANARARARERTREKLSKMEKPVQFHHHHVFQANGSGYSSSNLLDESKAQGFSQNRVIKGHEKSTISSVSDRNLFTFPKWPK